MKKILTTLAFASMAMAGFAQETQEYVRVEFTVPMTSFDEANTGKKGTPVAAGMRDDYTYPNPQHQYLDFNVSENPIKFRSTTNSPSETSSFYMHQTRNTYSFINDDNAKMPYQCDWIKSITAYSIPVEKVVLIDSVPAKEVMINSEKDEKAWRVSEFTFNRLPRNVAELKTLIEPNGDGKRTHCHNPEFVVAVGYLLVPRLIDCAQDCRDMFDYLSGRQDGQSPAFLNAEFQSMCTATYNGGGDGNNSGGKDSNCLFWDHNHVYQWFDGALPSNQYKPNGKDYGYDKGPYKVYVMREVNPAAKNRYYLYNHPYDKSFANRTMENPDACPVYVVQTDKGFYLYQQQRNYFARGKAQPNPNL